MNNLFMIALRSVREYYDDIHIVASPLPVTDYKLWIRSALTVFEQGSIFSFNTRYNIDTQCTML